MDGGRDPPPPIMEALGRPTGSGPGLTGRIPGPAATWRAPDAWTGRASLRVDRVARPPSPTPVHLSSALAPHHRRRRASAHTAPPGTGPLALDGKAMRARPATAPARLTGYTHVMYTLAFTDPPRQCSPRAAPAARRRCGTPAQPRGHPAPPHPADAKPDHAPAPVDPAGTPTRLALSLTPAAVPAHHVVDVSYPSVGRTAAAHSPPALHAPSGRTAFTAAGSILTTGNRSGARGVEPARTRLPRARRLPTVPAIRQPGPRQRQYGRSWRATR